MNSASTCLMWISLMFNTAYYWIYGISSSNRQIQLEVIAILIRHSKY
jgi:hypothetical protein